jgi:hypothetical protein
VWLACGDNDDVDEDQHTLVHRIGLSSGVIVTAMWTMWCVENHRVYVALSMAPMLSVFRRAFMCFVVVVTNTDKDVVAATTKKLCTDEGAHEFIVCLYTHTYTHAFTVAKTVSRRRLQSKKSP